MSSSRTIYPLKIDRIIDHTSSIRELYLSTLPGQSFNFLAGQFVSLHVPQPDKPVLRAYSIASSAQQTNGFRLIFKFVPEGKASLYVWSLKEGDSVQITGPFGRLFFKEPPTPQIIFLNTGSGISQHFCYLETFQQKYPDLEYRILFGVQNESEIFYQKELLDLQKKFSNLQFDYVLSQSKDTWKGKKGYIQHFLNEFNYQKGKSTFYLCGNGMMIKEVKEKLAGENFEKTDIISESFT